MNVIQVAFSLLMELFKPIIFYSNQFLDFLDVDKRLGKSLLLSRLRSSQVTRKLCNHVLL